ncbi:dorsal-ventral patterning protein Sog-like [Sitophilus oryzae]|uniref:Dorsal-ventral patterning protein Sog-like n=1 Tax=Sitophilus oryzae TaxID=7048 RepID=A0A6J2X5Y5_SITOR|nr:dorsal-ventral patterning protein Sog-like [Sitophilus oryzae]
MDMLRYFVWFFLFVSLVGVVSARTKSPLKDDDLTPKNKAAAGMSGDQQRGGTNQRELWKTGHQPRMDILEVQEPEKSKCVFGKEIRELGSKWIPDLGQPIGILYCMRCECVPFQKKRRIVGRVQCYSIKEKCPVPTCDEPVLMPGRCCKTCPGDVDYVLKCL